MRTAVRTEVPSLGPRPSSERPPHAHHTEVCVAIGASCCGWIGCRVKEQRQEGRAGWRGGDWQVGESPGEVNVSPWVNQRASAVRWQQDTSVFLFHWFSSTPSKILVIINLFKVGDAVTLMVYHGKLWRAYKNNHLKKTYSGN